MLFATSFKSGVLELKNRLRQRSKDVHETAVAVELLRAAEFRKGEISH